MPILHSAFKTIKDAKKKTIRNQSIKSRIKTEVKKIIDLVAQKKLDIAKGRLKNTISEIDKAVSKGIIHKNTANRKKSRLMKKLNTLNLSP
jgi:small subunit ribosomal protein S20